jgi:hypothetical protein
MGIRLASDQIVKVETDHDLREKIATADIVCASVLGAEPVAIWSRPAARGLAANVIVVTFEITSRADRRRLSAIVGRLNGEDGSLSPEPR